MFDVTSLVPQYSSMEDFMASVDLMVDNACTFNEEDSQVYNVGVSVCV